MLYTHSQSRPDILDTLDAQWERLDQPYADEDRRREADEKGGTFADNFGADFDDIPLAEQFVRIDDQWMLPENKAAMKMDLVRDITRRSWSAANELTIRGGWDWGEDFRYFVSEKSRKEGAAW